MKVLYSRRHRSIRTVASQSVSNRRYDSSLDLPLYGSMQPFSQGPRFYMDSGPACFGTEPFSNTDNPGKTSPQMVLNEIMRKTGRREYLIAGTGPPV